MNTALIYRPNNRKLIWIAFACAIAIDVAAVGLARNKPQSGSLFVCSFDSPVQGTDVLPVPPDEPDIVLPPVLPPIEQQEFVEDDVTRLPIRPRKKTPVTIVPRGTGIDMARTMGFGSAKALTLYSPKPNYPYEARRGGTIGSGVAQLTVNSAAGNVLDARMVQSTGSPILDDTTIETLRRWRFKPGVAEKIDVPITYTLSGVSY